MIFVNAPRQGWQADKPSTNVSWDFEHPVTIEEAVYLITEFGSSICLGWMVLQTYN